MKIFVAACCVTSLLACKGKHTDTPAAGSGSAAAPAAAGSASVELSIKSIAEKDGAAHVTFETKNTGTKKVVSLSYTVCLYDPATGHELGDSAPSQGVGIDPGGVGSNDDDIKVEKKELIATAVAKIAPTYVVFADNSEWKAGDGMSFCDKNPALQGPPPPVAAPTKCAAGTTEVTISNNESAHACVKIPADAHWDASDGYVTRNDAPSEKLVVANDGGYDECLKDMKEHATSAGKITAEGDMPSKNGHWFDVKTKGGKQAYACVKVDADRSANCQVYQDTSSDALLSVCHDITVVAR